MSMQAVAAWLVARPLNSVLALAATVSLAWLSFLSGVVMMLLVLQKGPQRALVDMLLASALLAAVGLLVQAPLAAVVVGALSMWLPALLFGTLLGKSRSLTLMVQLSVIIVISGMLVFYLAVQDPVSFWRSVLETLIEVWRELGLTDQADLIANDVDGLAGQMTMVVALALWVVHTSNAILGYLFYKQLPGETADYGLFRDLNLGRVIAINMALASVIAFASDAVWLQNIAFVLFLVFFLQGLAVVHWLHNKGQLPVFGLIAVYVLMPILNIILLMGLAALGIIDTWFRLRRAKSE
jgi:hypothetical protein